MRRMLITALTIVFVLTSNPGYAALAPGQTPSEVATGLKRQLLLIPAGAVVQVKLHQKGTKKITGKLGPVTDEGFEVQTVKSGKVSSDKIAIADVQSVKEVKEKKGMSLVAKGLIVGGIAVGVFLLALRIIITD